MTHKISQVSSTLLAALLMIVLLPGSLAIAQNTNVVIQSSSLRSIDPVEQAFTVPSTPLIDEQAPLFSIVRDANTQSHLLDESTVINLGMQLNPVQGLNIRADAWRLEAGELNTGGLVNDWQSILPSIYLEGGRDFNLDNSMLGSSIESNGFDLGVSYAWDTSQFGQFTLSSKARYVDGFDGRLELGATSLLEGFDANESLLAPKLQSSLMLTWQLGNHQASAVTNYFDSLKDLGEMDLDEINALVDNLTTVDLQYGYSVNTGSNDKAIISIGIRNIFNEKTMQILNSNARILDQNGRVAYGAIKYQF